MTTPKGPDFKGYPEKRRKLMTKLTNEVLHANLSDLEVSRLFEDMRREWHILAISNIYRRRHLAERKEAKGDKKP